MGGDGKPQRIVCLTAETTEIAFAAGAGERVVGVSGYAVRPPEARKKPHVAAFRTGHVDRIMALEPDLVLGFSDIQAELAGALIRAGANVLITNQRSLAETYGAIRLVANAIGEPEAGERIAGELRAGLESLAVTAGRRPRVFFEEWDEPLIAGIEWVSEIIELCGGEDVCGDVRGEGAATGRMVDPGEIAERAPEVVIASWCGKKVRPERIVARAGWADVPAVRDRQVHEIKAPDILQPGPSLIHGARQVAEIIAAVG